ncbi:DUF1330 domain-containing protein [Pseudomonas putida]|uniref:DUF1330 domain-containing protein n=1 Tax=Pseudomonas putida TaxID=303 RepID=UPI00117B5071|nr:DUF1330 domain-containing protein [Pseudomonas putida]TRO38256.1 DUF1330 domain-containing protein [Pseudomonas putida]
MSYFKLAKGALLGGVLFAAHVSIIYADETQVSSAPGYYVAEFEVTDPEGIKPYSAKVESTFRPYGGRFIVRGGQITSLEGAAPKRKRVVIEFESVEKAKEWYSSPEYSELKKVRQRSAKTDVYLIEGINQR